MQNTQIYTIPDKWYSWVPTNLGKLNFAYIGDSSSLQKVFGHDKFQVESITKSKKKVTLTNTNLSDLNPINRFLNRITEVKDSACIEIAEKNTVLIGTVTIDYNQKAIIQSDFKIKSNGKTEISNVSVSYDTNQVNQVKSSSIFDDTIVTAIYTILKKVIHGDNHHEQKIDTFIGVYKGSFNPVAILDSFATNIKSRERVIKDSSGKNCYYKQQKILSSIETDGYISYIETFKLLFQTTENEDALKDKINYIKNVAKSLKASVEKIKFDLDLQQKNITLLMTFVAFVVSINILHNGLYGAVCETDINGKINYIIDSIFIVLFMYLLAARIVCYSRYLSRIENVWEYLRYLALEENFYISYIVTLVSVVIISFSSLVIIKSVLTFILKTLLA